MPAAKQGCGSGITRSRVVLETTSKDADATEVNMHPVCLIVCVLACGCSDGDASCKLAVVEKIPRGTSRKLQWV